MSHYVAILHVVQLSCQKELIFPLFFFFFFCNQVVGMEGSFGFLLMTFVSSLFAAVNINRVS